MHILDRKAVIILSGIAVSANRWFLLDFVIIISWAVPCSSSSSCLPCSNYAETASKTVHLAEILPLTIPVVLPAAMDSAQSRAVDAKQKALCLTVQGTIPLSIALHAGLPSSLSGTLASVLLQVALSSAGHACNACLERRLVLQELALFSTLTASQ